MCHYSTDYEIIKKHISVTFNTVEYTFIYLNLIIESLNLIRAIAVLFKRCS